MIVVILRIVTIKKKKEKSINVREKYLLLWAVTVQVSHALNLLHHFLFIQIRIKFQKSKIKIFPRFWTKDSFCIILFLRNCSLETQKRDLG